MMDFVFSESEGGIYDNRNGMDYHIPVSDSVAREPPMHIVHIAVEMAPIAKVDLHFIFCDTNDDGTWQLPIWRQVGGLGDVVTSLSRAVQDLGHKVEVILPKYDCLNLNSVSLSTGVKCPASSFLSLFYLSPHLSFISNFQFQRLFHFNEVEFI
jgi:starch synthase